MKWKKLGLIVKPGKFEWMVSHAQNPFCEQIDDDNIKIHFAGRDKRNRARGGWCIFNMQRMETTEYHPEPSLDLGNLGCFDDSGAMPSCIIEHDNKKYLYYTGWSKAVTTPFTFYIGLLTSSNQNNDSYERYSLAPVLGRTKNDPYLSCSPWVIKENSLWKMWYVSGTGWTVEPGDPDPKHYYNIKYAESKDGINWQNEGLTCIDFNDDEYAIARPTVRYSKGIYQMWYCFRGGFNRYRAGYAESKDGKSWTRLDNQTGIDISEDGWDSNMICYPCSFEYQSKEYLLYNGNDYGRTGIGLAVREE